MVGNTFLCSGSDSFIFVHLMNPTCHHLLCLCQMYRTSGQRLLIMFYVLFMLCYNASHSQYTTTRYNRPIQNLVYQSIVYITDKCEYVSVQNQENVVLRVCGNNYLLPFILFFFFSFVQFFFLRCVCGCLKACMCV